jgi:hypothetical protein
MSDIFVNLVCTTEIAENSAVEVGDNERFSNNKKIISWPWQTKQQL